MRTLRPAPIYVHHHRRSPSSHAPRCKATTNDAIAQTTQQLITLIQEIGMPASILPGSEPQRQQIDAIINALPATVQQPTGETQWRLVYASNGTYVTRQPIIQALVALSQLPGTGLQDVQQRLCVGMCSHAVSLSYCVMQQDVIGYHKASIALYVCMVHPPCHRCLMSPTRTQSPPYPHSC